jgi:hypothetical protein
MSQNPNQNAVTEFVKLINNRSYRGKHYNDGIVPLTNITCFCGAGFSKSWDKRYPTGDELFTIEPDYSKTTALSEFLDYIGYERYHTIIPQEFKEIVYQIDMQLKYPDIRMRYIDRFNLYILKRELVALVYEKFNSRIKLNYFSPSTDTFDFKAEDAQKPLINFFTWLHDHETGDRDGLAEGIRVHYLTTNYDFLIESILDQIESFYQNNTYRGFSTSEFNGREDAHIIVHNQWLVRNLIKINGGFEIFEKGNEYKIDYREPKVGELKKNPPVIILPSKEQDYTSNYFQAVFPKAVRMLQESKILVIIGSGLPEEDAVLRILLRQFAEEKIDSVPKVIFYIDFMSNPEKSPEEKSQELKERIYNVYPYLKSDSRYTYLFTYDKGFNEFIKECETSTNGFEKT